MKILKQDKKTVTVELTPVELEILRGGLTKESSNRRRTWKQVSPKFPEELMYHFIMHDTAEQMKIEVYKAMKVYQRWGILK